MLRIATKMLQFYPSFASAKRCRQRVLKFWLQKRAAKKLASVTIEPQELVTLLSSSDHVSSIMNDDMSLTEINDTENTMEIDSHRSTHRDATSSPPFKIRLVSYDWVSFLELILNEHVKIAFRYNFIFLCLFF